MSLNEKMEFEQLLQQPEQCLKLARAICAHHNIAPDGARITGGSRLLYATADHHIIKIFPPHEPEFFETETVFLANLHKRLPISIPHLSAAAYWGKHPYIVMDQLEGSPFGDIFPSLSDSEQRRLIMQLGQAVRAMHELPIGLFRAAPFDWHSFIDDQQRSLLTHHRSFGLGEPWLAQLSEYIDRVPLDLHDAAQMVPIHTELMREHIFVRKEGADWIISGLIDFEPSMIGHREYEFCAVGLFITPGRSDLFRLFLSSYGYRDTELTEQLSRRIMKLLLLHRYSNLKWFMTLIPREINLSNLHQLEQYWFSL